MENKNIVYALLYSSCVDESDFETISLHWTKSGVVKAMRKLKDEHFINQITGYTPSRIFRFKKFAYKKMVIEN